MGIGDYEQIHANGMVRLNQRWMGMLEAGNEITDGLKFRQARFMVLAPRNHAFRYSLC
jgi:hypothetical protein